jgi:hypothetical protein
MNETIDRFRGILRRLLERSRKDQVRWHRKPDDEGRTFEVWFPDQGMTIAVTFVSPPTAPDWTCAEQIVNNETVATIDAEEGDNSEDFGLLSEIWHDAHRRVHGWDQALDKLENALQSEGTVGAEFPF